MSTTERLFHERPLELAATAVDRHLTAAEAVELDAHVAGCAVCAGRSAAMHGDALVLDRPFAPYPSRRVDDAVYAAIAGTSGRPLGFLVLVAAALLVIALVGAIAVGAALFRERDESPITVAPTPPAAVASPIPTVLAPPLAISWERVGTIPVSSEFFGAEASSIGNVVGTPDGYIGIGTTRTVWTSADGRSWGSVELPFDVSTSAYGQPLDATVSAIASSGSQVLIVGGYAHEPCTRPSGDVGAGALCPLSPISWVSDDGMTWRSSHPWTGPTPPAGYEQGAEFTDVWSAATGGWDAVLGYWQGEALTGQEIWHSDDGISWAKLGPVLEEMISVNATPSGITDPDGRRLLWAPQSLYNEVGGYGGVTTLLATSSDGSDWQEIDGFPSSGSKVWKALAPAADSGSWILVGSTMAGDVPAGTPTVWVSTDLSNWTTIQLPVSAAPAELCAMLERTVPCTVIERVDAVIRTNDGYLAVGSLIDDGYGRMRSAIWQSPDGLTWSETDQPDLAIPILAGDPVDLIAVGVPDGEDVVAVWRAEAP